MSSIGEQIMTALSGLLKPRQSSQPSPIEAAPSEMRSSLPPELSFQALSEVTPLPDSSMPSEKPTYALPLQEWDETVALANHLAKREAEMPLRRRMETFLQASNQAHLAGLSDSDDDQGKD